MIIRKIKQNSIFKPVVTTKIEFFKTFFLFCAVSYSFFDPAEATKCPRRDTKALSDLYISPITEKSEEAVDLISVLD